MTTRRNFIAGVAGTTAVTTLAGCLGIFDDDEEPEEDPIPGEGLDTDDELLLSVADPSSQVPPVFFSGYQYRVSDLIDELDVPETIPRAGGSVAGLFEDSIEEIPLSDIDRITGGIYHSTASGGDLQFEPLPSGQAVHATGTFDADPLVELVEDSEAHTSLGESDGFERYFTTISGGDGVEGWGIQDDRLIIVSRVDVTSRSGQYDDQEETIRDALAIEFDQIERENAPIANSAPAFAESVQQLDDGPIRGGTAYALVPKGADTGTEAFDDVVNGIVGGGLSASVGESPALQRTLSYLEPEFVSEQQVTAAYEASETDTIPVEDWSFSIDEMTISARANPTETPPAEMLETALPIPGYGNLFTRINPGELGREPTPRVFFAPSVDDGQLRITHDGGDELQDLQVRYVHDGSVQQEPWDGPVVEGDEFTSEETVDSNTQAWVTWRPDTKDAAVLVRFRPS